MLIAQLIGGVIFGGGGSVGVRLGVVWCSLSPKPLRQTPELVRPVSFLLLVISQAWALLVAFGLSSADRGSKAWFWGLPSGLAFCGS